jgi:diaminobutyrate-2-oxoglutarate transaminase
MITATDTEIFEQRESAVRTYCRGLDVVLVSARGSLVRGADGREYIDFLAGAGALNYGHNDPDMKDALLEYISGDGIAHGLDLYTEAKRAFLQAFDDLVLTPRGMDHHVQFTGPTGANAVEAALKLARRVTGRTNIIAFTRGFHGLSQGALAATGNRAVRMAPHSVLHGVTRLPYDGYLGSGVDTAELLAAMLADPSGGVDAPAAILLETVQGEGGLNPASPRWLRRVAALAREHGALLVVDDIQAGCGRTGTFFSTEAAGVVPDVLVLSKSLSGFGLPMSVVLMRPEYDLWEPGQHTGTFRGNAHAFVTATVALLKFWATGHFAQDVERRAGLVTRRLQDLADQVPGAQVKGRGLMQGLEVDPATAAWTTRGCVNAGLIMERAGPRGEVLKVFAPLTTPDELLEHGLDLLAGCVLAGRAARTPVSA